MDNAGTVGTMDGFDLAPNFSGVLASAFGAYASMQNAKTAANALQSKGSSSNLLIIVGGLAVVGLLIVVLLK